MKTGILLSTVFLFLASFAYAQAPDTLWTRNYGFSADDQAWQVQSTPDGGFIVVGMADVGSPSDIDVYLLKTDANGDTSWTNTYDFNTLVDVGLSVLSLDDGGYIVTGYKNVFGYDDDLILFKVDSTGDIEWFQIYEGATGRSIKGTADGGFVIAGFTRANEYSLDMYVAKFDSAGSQIWYNTYGGTSDEKAWDICETPQGDLLVVGWTESYGEGGSDIYVIKTNSEGELIWYRTYGDQNNDEGRSIVAKDDGGFVIAGKISPDPYSSQAAIVSADSNGWVLWSRIVYDSTSASAIANSVTSTSDGGYVITGMKRDHDIMFSSSVIKFDMDGDSLWSRIIRDPEQNLYGRSVIQTSDGGYAAAGYHQLPNHNNDVFLVKLGPDFTGIDDDIAMLPGQISLHQNYPNPFNASTIISFSLSDRQDIRLAVYDILGREIEVLVDGEKDAGIYNVVFDASGYSSGIFFYKLQAGATSQVKPMILLK